MTLPNSIVFLVDVDNTLLDNDRIQDDIKRHLDREFGVAARERYWTILEQLFADLGYRDYLGALQRYRVEHPRDIHLLSMSSFLVDYPFANRLYPGSLDVLERFRGWGQTVILSDGDVVFQPRKVERSGIFEAVEGHVLIYIHKEKALDDVERRYPAEHYVLVKLAAAIKESFGSVANLKGQLNEAALNVQGSGWGTLAWEPLAKRLVTEQVYDHQGNIGNGTVPLLVLDMWEHAYYLQYQNVKGEWVKAFWKIVNWEDVRQRLQKVRTLDLGL